MTKLGLSCVALIVLSTVAGTSAGQTPASVAGAYESMAQAESRDFAGFSAARGEYLFQTTHGNDWSCTLCHTKDPRANGRHARTGKPIASLAPATNPERFTSFDKVEKWFRRNCNDVLGRPCTAQEKGDVLAYLMSLKP